MDMHTIFDNEPYLNPKYDKYNKYVNIMYRGFWTPAKYEKLIYEQDAPHYHNEMGVVDKECIKRCILAISTVENCVKVFWSTLPLDIPQVIVSDVCGLFAQSEVTHRRSYHSLSDALGIRTEEIHEHDALKDRIAYLTKHTESDPNIMGRKKILKKLVLFTSLVERASLFTQFYILMSYARNNKGLKTISSLQRSTAQEEVCHYDCGIDLINDIKEETPQYWSEYLIDLVEKNIQMAYEAELKLIDWFFENGTPEHLTREEVVNFLNYNFSVINKDLDLDMDFTYDEEMFNEKNNWMIEKITAPVEVDFFDNNAGGYASEDEDVDVDQFDFN